MTERAAARLPPKDRSFCSTLALLREGYLFISNRRASLKTDIFETRLLLQNVICIGGPEAARFFYDPEIFIRRDALPKMVQRTLTGEQGVQTLDGEAHRRRKAAFLTLMTPARVAAFPPLLEDELRKARKRWAERESVILLAEAQEALFRAACRWSGVPSGAPVEMRRLAADMGRMVDAFGTVGFRHWRGRKARRRAEEWATGLIRDARARRLQPAHETALHLFSGTDGAPGDILPRRVAAVELLNILRPITAISYYAAFAALALAENPAWRQRVLQEASAAEIFAQEVRRFYPFTPFVGAYARKDAQWQGWAVPQGSLVLLDVYGIDRDPRLWAAPERFDPERFAARRGGLYDFIPQGGGHPETGHRCAGENITVEALKVIVRFLADTRCRMPAQDTRIDLSRMPARPRSGIVLSCIQAG